MTYCIDCNQNVGTKLRRVQTGYCSNGSKIFYENKLVCEMCASKIDSKAYRKRLYLIVFLLAIISCFLLLVKSKFKELNMKLHKKDIIEICTSKVY